LRSGGGKQKGAAFERQICERLSRWITNGKRKDCFWRSAMSGGRATVGTARGHAMNRVAGDICSVSPEGHALTDRYYFELKHVKDSRLETFILHNKGPIAGWWRKAFKEAKKYGRAPVLIVKSNHYPILLVTTPNCLLNKHPVAVTKRGYLRRYNPEEVAIGLFERMVSQPFEEAP
jgi:hypothetical protein